MQREEKGRDIATHRLIVCRGKLWEVPSQSGKAHAMRNERRPCSEQRSRKMCLAEKKEATTFSQGGTYEQYRRWIRAYPDLFRIQSLNAVVVRRSRGDDGPSSQTRGSEQDH